MHLHTSGIVNVQQRGQDKELGNILRTWHGAAPLAQCGRKHPYVYLYARLYSLWCTSKRELTSDMEPPQLESMMRP